MTSVYGVTQLGARDQIVSRLKERGMVSDEHTSRAAAYGAKVRSPACPSTVFSHLGPGARAHWSSPVLVRGNNMHVSLV